MGRLIGIDYGQKRTGIAVTDPEQRIPGALKTIESHRLYDFLNTYISSEEVDGFVVGYPRQLNYQPSESARYVKDFAKGLQKKFPDIPIFFVDERYTSKMATDAMRLGGLKKKARQDKHMIDAISAVLILESHLSQIYRK